MEADAFMFHHELDGATTFTARETLADVLGRTHIERRALV